MPPVVTQTMPPVVTPPAQPVVQTLPPVGDPARAAGGPSRVAAGGATSPCGTATPTRAGISGAYLLRRLAYALLRRQYHQWCLYWRRFPNPISNEDDYPGRRHRPVGPPVTGTTYVAADGSFFYANLTTPVSQPSQREFIYGGTPINPQFSPATATTPGYLAFNVQPDAALKSSIPFIRAQTGGSLGSSASVSPLILATPLNTQLFDDNW